MSASSVFVQLQKPFKTNKKLFGLVSVALLIIGGLAATYYFHIQTEQAHLREYKLRMLDSYYDKIQRKLNNDELRKKAVKTKASGTNFELYIDSTLSKRKNKAEAKALTPSQKIDSINNAIYTQIRDSIDAVYTTKEKIRSHLDRKEWVKNLGDQLKLRDEFTEFIIMFEDNGDTIQESSLAGLHEFNSSFIFKKDTLKTGVIRNIKLNEEAFLLIGRKYLFQSKMNPDIEKHITLIGLIDDETYSKATRELDPWLIALLSAFLLICLIGLPFFKMIFIAEDERLFSSDVILAGISVVIGAPVILAVFLSLISYGEEYFVESPAQLESLSYKIKSRFENENRENIIGLESLELNKYDYIPRFEDVTAFIAPYDVDTNLRHNFKYVSKLFNDGKVDYHLNFIVEPPIGLAPITLEDRTYFKDIKANNNAWHLKNKEGDKVDYVIRPVVSIEDESEEAVYIIPIEGTDGYKVGSVQLKSLHNPILPFGYSFAIIDEQGEVWFHSESGKSTLEDFYAVSKNVKSLNAAVRGRIASDGQLEYHGEARLFHTLPIEGTNLSVVSLYDVSLLRLKVSEVLSICSMAILLAFLLLGLITVVSVYLKNPRWGLYKYQDFLFEFLIPREAKRINYIYLILIFGSILVLLSATASLFNFLPSSAFLSSILLIVWSYAIVYFVLSDEKKSKLKKWSIREILLSLIIVVINLIVFETIGRCGYFIALLILQFLCGSAIIAFRKKKVQDWLLAFDFNRFSGLNLGYKYWYAIFLFCWLLLSSILPTHIFFNKAKAIDEIIWIKTDQFNYAHEYEQKEKLLKEDKLVPVKGKEKSFEVIYEEHLINGTYLSENYSPLTKKDVKRGILQEPSDFRKLLWKSRPIYDERIRYYQSLIYQSSLDSTWQSDEQASSMNFRLRDKDNNKKDVVSTYNSLTSKVGNHGLKGFISDFVFILGVVIIMALAFVLILFYVDRFFGFRFKHLKVNDFDTGTLQGYLQRFVDVLKSEKSNSGVILIGVPVSGKSRFAQNIIKRGNYEQWGKISFLQPHVEEEDIEKLIDRMVIVESDEGKMNTDWKSVEVFVLENLEHNIMSFEMNREKLRIISYLISTNKRIILTSEVYPSQILGFYKDQANEEGKMDGKLANDYNSWRNILSSFPQIIIGITNKKAMLMESLPKDEAFKNVPKDVLEELACELGYSNYLPTLAPIILTKNIYDDSLGGKSLIKLDDQRMIMHTLNLSHGYYTDLWNSLPRRERYLLYDLAKDGFMNIKNGNSLFSLMKKGIIVWRDRPTIFNQSFRNFIVSSVSKEEALSYEYKNRGEGSWGTFRIVFYLIILTIIIFIILGEPGLLKDFETFYTALAGLGAIIPIASSMLAKGNSK